MAREKYRKLSREFHDEAIGVCCGHNVPVPSGCKNAIIICNVLDGIKMLSKKPFAMLCDNEFQASQHDY